MSGQLVRFEVEDGIGVITVDNPPVNALSPGVPEGILESVAKGNKDPNVKAMVLIGAGRSFIAGADIRQFGKGAKRAGIGERVGRRTGAGREADRCGDPWFRARRRARDRHGLQLPHRQEGDQGRPAGSADRSVAGWRGHAAAAASGRSEDRARHDHQRPSRAGGRGQGLRHSRCAGRRQGRPARGSDQVCQEHRRQEADAGGQQDVDEVRRVQERPRHVRCDAQEHREEGEGPAGAVCLHQRGRSRSHASLRPGSRARARAVRAAGEFRRVQGPALRLLRRASGRPPARSAGKAASQRRSRRAR